VIITVVVVVVMMMMMMIHPDAQVSAEHHIDSPGTPLCCVRCSATWTSRHHHPTPAAPHQQWQQQMEGPQGMAALAAAAL
jgi:hypothetical protein